jgi:hypothetical protein
MGLLISLGLDRCNQQSINAATGILARPSFANNAPDSPRFMTCLATRLESLN